MVGAGAAGGVSDPCGKAGRAKQQMQSERKIDFVFIWRGTPVVSRVEGEHNPEERCSVMAVIRGGNGRALPTKEAEYLMSASLCSFDLELD
jgi:hypothetical protein